MSEWYYARGGQQNGPVSFETLVELARRGELDPLKDLVWTARMKDWTPAGQVREIFASPSLPAVIPSAGNPNPYAPPQSQWVGSTSSQVPGLDEIVPGSESIDAGACVKRGFNLAVRNIGMLLIIVLVYCVVTGGSSFLLGQMDNALGLQPLYPAQPQPGIRFNIGFSTYQNHGSPLNVIIAQVISVFLSLGVTRIGLNVVSGREFSVEMLFGGGRKLLPALGATILYALMVGVGLVLLIVPGIYLAMRYGQFLTAMVDRNLGIMESFSYSSSITTNNRLNLFVLALLYILIAIAGCLALCVGILFAYPVIMLSGIVAYRWMQYGHRAVMDHPGTQTPMLSGV
jgi:hypothetical protein